MMLGVADSNDGDEKPALMVYAPLSTMRVLEGGGGQDDLVRR